MNMNEKGITCSLLHDGKNTLFNLLRTVIEYDKPNTKVGKLAGDSGKIFPL